ncbi:MAG TPA: hypothetical protein VGI61_13620 [Parafilimonas sp.]|jgi:hypothetical protein
MAAKKETKTPSEKIALYNKLIATNPGIERKGDTNPYTSCNGNMFTHMTPEGILSIRLPEKEPEAFIKKYRTKLMEAYGVVRKEYAVVPDSLLQNTIELKPYLDISFEYAKSLKPKPTSKIKK